MLSGSRKYGVFANRTGRALVRGTARSGCLEDGAKPSFPTSQDQCSGRAGSPTTRSSPRRAPSPVRRGPRPSVATPPQRSAAAARCARHSSAACSSRAISHAPKRRVSRSIMGAGPPGVAASGDRSRPSRMSGTGSAVSPSARHLAWRCWSGSGCTSGIGGPGVLRLRPRCTP